jgi:O-antigen biosynthesis protein
MIPTANAGVNYYRLWCFAQQMRKFRNVEVSVFGFKYDMNNPHPWQADMHSMVQSADEHTLTTGQYVRRAISSLCEVADAVIWQPVFFAESLEFYMDLRARTGKPMFMETDDNFIDVPTWNEAFHSFGPGGAVRAVALQHMRESDGVFTTTPHLREIYSQFNPNIHEIPNSIDFKGDSQFVGWGKVANRRHRDVRIGWIGGRCHYQDLQIVLDPLKRICNEFPNVTIRFVNSALRTSAKEQGLPDPFAGINKKQVQYSDRSVPINRYAQFFAHQSFDIGLAPLEDCNFNRSKSNLRWLEYSALKIPTIASKVGHFQKTVINGKDGILVDNGYPNGWYDAIRSLVLNEVTRREMGKAAYKRVKQDFEAQKTSAKYVRLLKELSSFDPRLESEFEQENEWTGQPSLHSSAI